MTDIEVANLKESLQDEVITYFGAYESSIPFTYTEEQHEQFVDDICDLIVRHLSVARPT